MHDPLDVDDSYMIYKADLQMNDSWVMYHIPMGKLLKAHSNGIQNFSSKEMICLSYNNVSLLSNHVCFTQVLKARSSRIQNFRSKEMIYLCSNLVSLLSNIT